MRPCRHVFVATLLALSCTSAWSQGNAPLTQPPAAAAVPAPAPAATTVAPTPTPAPAPAAATRPVVQAVAAPGPAPAQPAAAEPAFGDTTRLLIAAQGDGRRAGTDLPMVGEAATRAWERYMDSFSQPIPEWFNDQRGVTEQ